MSGFFLLGKLMVYLFQVTYPIYACKVSLLTQLDLYL
jgi:hypothetical protein